jgi:hypothetical protein
MGLCSSLFLLAEPFLTLVIEPKLYISSLSLLESATLDAKLFLRVFLIKARCERNPVLIQGKV